jgi:type II secretory ATPase GspE/PulE/Tfp pilus assembly ATPase PilB-like protein
MCATERQSPGESWLTLRSPNGGPADKGEDPRRRGVAHMATHDQGSPAINWPLPPFFRFAGLPPPDKKCAVELTGGVVTHGELVNFDLNADSVVVRVPDSKSLRRIKFGRIRSIKLAAPIAYVADVAALESVAATVRHADDQRSFVVALRDGTTIKGITLGFIKETAGVFLYVVEGETALAINWFIPAGRIDNLQIGPLLGETLVDRNVVSPETLALALNQQTKLRQERIGSYLAERAIISSEQLIRAIGEQGKRPNARLGDILIEAGMITSDQLQEALTIQIAHRERRIGDILVTMGVVSMRLIQVALSDKLGIPYANVREFHIAPGVLETIDMAFALRHQVLPLVKSRTSLIVAVENPLAIDFLQDLRFQMSLMIDPVIADPQELKERISKEYSALAGRLAATKRWASALGVSTLDPGDSLPNSGAVQTKVADLTSQLARETQQSQRAVKEVATDSRVSENTLVKLVNKIIIDAHSQGASDIHIESNGGSSYTRIRFRKDGDLEDYLELPQTYSNSVVSRIKIMAELDISEHRHPQDGKIDFGAHGPLPIELRVAIIPTANNLEDVVLRILGGAEPLPLDQVGFSDLDLGLLRKMISRSFGLFLVCGPTGSGKTTTLHSLLREINRPDLKIWTAEDPIEITQPGLRQVQVHAKIDWTFAAAMRAFLRADPDVIMVGEMRDAETTKIGIEASLTGHLVISTLHTNSAAESVVRLLDLGMDPFNFADALIGVLSQRLARKLCVHCKQAHVATATEISTLVDEYCTATSLDRAGVVKDWRARFFNGGSLLLQRAAGCDACRQGYAGRIVIYELLASTPDIKHLVRTRAAVPEVLALAQKEGMVSLRQNAITQVLRGVIDLASARAVAS